MKNKKASKGILIDVALLLVCLACITTCLSSGIVARFVSRANGTDAARVAEWFNVGVSASDQTVDLKPGETKAEYTLSLSNDSETTVVYSLILTFDEDVSGFITAEIGSKSGIGPDASGKVICLNDIGTIAAGEDAAVSFSLVVSDTNVGLASVDFNTVVRFTQAD